MFWANTPKQVFRSEIYAVTKKYANFALICAHMATLCERGAAAHGLSTDSMEQDKPFKYLQHINSPADLRKLRVDELPAVCDELRRDIINELADNPGHFASSLGTVEITVAMHYVYDTPYDRIVWDVGHQAYGHKILTGRRDAFHTNRKLHGIRPFPSPQESEYDTFACGHASNSIRQPWACRSRPLKRAKPTAMWWRSLAMVR